MSKKSRPRAISDHDYERYGCPYCDTKTGTRLLSSGWTKIMVCPNCEREYAVLEAGSKRSEIPFFKGDFYPTLSIHPKARLRRKF